MEGLVEFLDVNSVSMLNGVARGMLLFLIASGLSLIFGMLDVLNLSHGVLFAVGAYLAYTFVGPGAALLLALGAAVIVGILLGAGLRLALIPVRGQGHSSELLVTLGILYIGADLIPTIWGNDFLRVPPPAFLAGSVTIPGGHSYPAYRLAVIGIGALVALVLWLVFERTRLGALVRATVADESMVGAAGINTSHIRTGILIIGAVLATVGGVLAAPVLSLSPFLADEFLLLAFVVLVIGGAGSLQGALVGSLVVGQVQSTLSALFPDFSGFLLFGVMALVLIVRPGGLFGKTT